MPDHEVITSPRWLWEVPSHGGDKVPIQIGVRAMRPRQVEYRHDVAPAGGAWWWVTVFQDGTGLRVANDHMTEPVSAEGVAALHLNRYANIAKAYEQGGEALKWARKAVSPAMFEFCVSHALRLIAAADGPGLEGPRTVKFLNDPA
ncbi:hypothetical protein [Salininema proteolyticum]|uniref:Uncharacterized protein n=1 Tax=Salininema proteolyticum TaxID=1607685 RepID=A0ABV8TUG5_9ACTN